MEPTAKCDRCGLEVADDATEDRPCPNCHGVVVYLGAAVEPEGEPDDEGESDEGDDEGEPEGEPDDEGESDEDDDAEGELPEDETPTTFTVGGNALYTATIEE